MVTVCLWVFCASTLAVMASAAPSGGISHNPSRHRISLRDDSRIYSGSNDQMQRPDGDHVTSTPQSDSSATQYGAHRVDRTVLFPHDTTWCVARPIQQVIEHDGCMSRTVDNKMCAGQCFSYSVPMVSPHPADIQFHSCECCKPSRASWAVIPLFCNENESYTIVEKHVQLVAECECEPCFRRDSPNVIHAPSSASNATETPESQSSFVEISSYVDGI